MDDSIDVIYSVAGEGRGHATRARAVIETLRSDYRLLVLAAKSSFPILSEAFADDPAVTVREIQGLLFHHRGSRVNYTKSTICSLPYLFRLRGVSKSLADEIKERNPSLAIVDFDPALPRAARRASLPFVTFDHQHFLVVNNLSSLPLRLRWKAYFLRSIVGLFCAGQKRTIVSSFFDLPLRPSKLDAVQVGPLLRSEVLQAKPTDDGHILAYTKGTFPENVLETLRTCGRPVRLYGHGAGSPDGNIKKCPISERGFLQDLVTCHAVLCNAGNQLIGEARYLGKPVFALPEPGNFEQELNAHFITGSPAIGVAMPANIVNSDRFAGFLNKVPKLRRSLLAETNSSGNERALAVLRHEIEAARLGREESKNRSTASTVHPRSASTTG